MGFSQVIVFALLAGAVAYYAYNPLPKDMEQKFLFSGFTSTQRLIIDLGKISQAVGWKDMLVFRRDMAASVLSFFHIPMGDDIKFTATTFGGVPVWVYQPATRTGSDLGPGFVYVHGFVPNAAVYDGQMAQIVRDAGVVVMSIDYRLAPEHPSPAGIEDCVAATSHFFAHAKDWGVDAGRIGVGGDSVGGNMAAVLAQKYRDMGGRPQFSYQVLIYPWTQSLDFNLPSYAENAVYNMPLLKPKGVALLTLKYLGLDPKQVQKLAHGQHVSKATQKKYQSIMDTKNLGSEHHASYTRKDDGVDEELAAQMEAIITNPYNFPLMARGLEGLPPALVATMGYDTIRDDGLLYSARLTKAGVKTEHYQDDICWHGSFNFATGKVKSDCGVRLLEQVVKYINQAKANAPIKK